MSTPETPETPEITKEEEKFFDEYIIHLLNGRPPENPDEKVTSKFGNTMLSYMNALAHKAENQAREIQKLYKERLELIEKMVELQNQVRNNKDLAEDEKYLLIRNYEKIIAEERNIQGKHELTGMPTERILDENIESLAQTGGKVMVAYMDLTKFKAVNTEIGYDNANEVLKIYGRALIKAISSFENEDENKKITPYHTHGDEFAAIFENITDEEIVKYARAVEEIAQAQLKILEKKLRNETNKAGEFVLLENQTIFTNLSFGVVPLGDSSSEDFVKEIKNHADDLLNVAKLLEKGSTCIQDKNGNGVHYPNSENSEKNSKKTNDEITALIREARKAEKQKEIEEKQRREDDEKRRMESEPTWKKNFSAYKDLPDIIKVTLQYPKKDHEFSKELKILETDNANLDMDEKLKMLELYLGKKLTVIQKRIFNQACKVLSSDMSKISMIAERNALLSKDFTEKDVQIMMRSGLLGVAKEEQK